MDTDLETIEEINYKMNYKKILENMRIEDVLEYLYEISDKWEKSDNQIENMREDLMTMTRKLKEEKFTAMDMIFGLI